jgi:hypothetical protein
MPPKTLSKVGAQETDESGAVEISRTPLKRNDLKAQAVFARRDAM